MSNNSTSNDISAEHKILRAAEKIFTTKGFSGTKTRDIAEEAGINLALLNYYFRSKQKLFQRIMTEKIQQMFGTVVPILIDPETSLDEKIDLATEKYLDLLEANPNLPLFIISEIQKENSEIVTVLPVEEIIKNSTMLQQISEKNSTIDPMQFLINFLGLTIFPFISHNLMTKFEIFDQTSFKKFVEERRILIPIWMKTLLATQIINSKK